MYYGICASSEFPSIPNHFVSLFYSLLSKACFSFDCAINSMAAYEGILLVISLSQEPESRVHMYGNEFKGAKEKFLVPRDSICDKSL